MTKLKTIILICQFLVLLGCTENDADFRLSDFNTPKISGFYLRNALAEPVGTIGIPNVRLGSSSNSSSSLYYFTPYPNPCSNFCTFWIKSPVNNSVKKLWIVQAEFDHDIPGYSIDMGMNNIVVGGQPLFQAEFTENNLSIDVSNLYEGYYRVYLKIDDILLYDNLIIYNY